MLEETESIKQVRRGIMAELGVTGNSAFDGILQH